MTPKSVFILAFTGHRDLKDAESIRPHLREALLEYRGEAERLGGALHLHCSLAYGADLLVIEEAEKLCIPIHLLLPKHLGPEESDGDRAGMAGDFVDGKTGVFRQEDWGRARQAIRSAEQGINGGSIRVVLPESPDPECYYDVGVRMLTVADALLAVWDGQPARGLGGSAEICDHARMLGVPVRVIPVNPGSGRIPRGDGEVLLLSGGNDLALSLLGLCDGSSESLFHRLDEQAARLGASFRTRMTASIRLHFYATLLASLAASLVTVPWAKYVLLALAVAEGGLVVAAWWLQRINHHDNTQARWLDLRFAAEIARSIRSTRDLADPLYPCVQKHQAEWARFARTLALMMRSELPKVPGSWTQSRSVYVRERLDEQVAYFERKQKQGEAESARIGRLAVIATDLAPWAVAGALACKLLEKSDWLGSASLASFSASVLLPEWFRLLPIALPLAAGYLGALRQASDAERRRVRYAELAVKLRVISRNIVHLRTESSVVHAVGQAEEVLLSEQLEWRLRESQAAHH